MILESIKREYRHYKNLAERAIAQTPEDKIHALRVPALLDADLQHMLEHAQVLLNTEVDHEAFLGEAFEGNLVYPQLIDYVQVHRDLLVDLLVFILATIFADAK